MTIKASSSEPAAAFLDSGFSECAAKKDDVTVSSFPRSNMQKNTLSTIRIQSQCWHLLPPRGGMSRFPPCFSSPTGGRAQEQYACWRISLTLTHLGICTQAVCIHFHLHRYRLYALSANALSSGFSRVSSFNPPPRLVKLTTATAGTLRALISPSPQ